MTSIDPFSNKKHKINSGTHLHRCTKSGCWVRFGNPFRQIRMPSSTPLQVSWLRTSAASITPDCFFSFGIMQRTKCCNKTICFLIKIKCWTNYRMCSIKHGHLNVQNIKQFLYLNLHIRQSHKNREDTAFNVGFLVHFWF